MDAAFVGRTREMEELFAAVDALARGRGGFILISGEPGIGKSRLLDEFISDSQGRGIRVLSGRAWEAGGAPPYWPWVQAVRTFIQDRSPENVREFAGPGADYLAQLIPELAPTDGGGTPALGSDPETARFRMFDAVAGLLTGVARTMPLIVTLEDIHAADEPSLLLLRFLAAMPDLPFLVAVTFRDTEIEDDYLAVITEIARQPGTRRLALRGLHENDLSEFIQVTAGAEPPVGLARLLHVETEGNPLFAGEIVRLLAHEGRFERIPDSLSLRRTIPPGIKEVITRRMSHLSDGARTLLRLACVLGRDFDIAVLQRLADQPRDFVLSGIDEVVAGRLLVESATTAGRFRFAHSLVRETVYEQLSITERIDLHRQTGTILEKMYGDDIEPHLAELAHHFFDAAPGGDTARAISYARRAAARAVELLAYEESIRLSAMARRLTDMDESVGDRLRCDVILDMGDAQARAGDARGAKESFREAAELAKRNDSPDQLARAAMGYGGRFVWEAARDDPYLRSLLEEALTELDEQENALCARVKARLAGGPMRDDPDREARDRVSREAVEVARRLGDPATLAYALDGRYAAVWWPENLKDRLDLAKELISAAQDAGDKERQLQGHHYLFLASLEHGDRTTADAELQDQVELAEELKQPTHLFYVGTVQAMMATFEGRYERSEELIQQAFRMGTRAEGAMARIYRALQLYALRRDLGRLDEVRADLEEAVTAFPTYFALKCALADVQVHLGDLDEARSLFSSLAQHDFGELSRNDEWLFSVCVLADVAVGLADAAAAASLYELLSPYRDRVAVSAPDVCFGAVSLFLGRLAAQLQRYDEAERHLEDAIELNARMRGAPWTTRAESAYSRVLLDRGRPNDADRAATLARRAFATCTDLGMTGIEADVVRLAREAGVSPDFDRSIKTFMFTDIVGSTDLVAAIGDEAWMNVVRWHDDALRKLFAIHGGREVDHAGDGFFVTFDDPHPAVRCAREIQRTLREHRTTHGFAPQVRIGLHRAEAIEAGDGFRGKGVHEAARIAAVAQGGDIRASRSTVAGIPDLRLLQECTVELKGVGPMDIVTIEWA